MSLAIVQLFIVLVVLAMSWLILTRIRSTPGRYVATAKQRRAWRRERLVVAYRNRRRV